MKRPALIALCLLLGGCSSTGNSDYLQFYLALRQSISASFGKGGITKAQAAAIPYASMGYRLNGGAEQLVVLATDTNGEQLWTSSAHIVIATRGGRIVRTVGLPANVSAVTPAAGQDLPSLTAASSGPLSYSRLEDLPESHIFGAALSCQTVNRGRQTIVIRGRGVPVVKVEEHCAGASLDWTFTDSYWLDPSSGLAWKSLQHISPKNGTIETEILRPPG